MAGEREHAEEWRDVIEALLGDPVTDATRGAFDYDDVPSPLPDLYALVTVTRRFGGDARSHGGKPMVGWRLTVLSVGRTVDEARWVREKVDTLDETRNATLATTLLVFEDNTTIEADGDRYSGLTSFTYATRA